MGQNGSTKDIMSNLKQNLNTRGADLVKTIKGVIVFCIGDETWTLDLTDGAGKLSEGGLEGGKPDLTLTVTPENFAKLVAGKLNPQQAFLFRKLKISGSMGMALKLSPVLEVANKPASKL